MKNIFLHLLSFFAAMPLLHAQISKVALLTSAPRLYEKSEWHIGLTAQWSNPYLQEDVALDMLITTPSGKKLTLPCYYESGSSGSLSDWKARFAPQETGRYHCRFRLSQSGKTVSTSRTVAFRVVPSGKNGFLHPKSNWVFQSDNGRPFRGIGENIGWESRAHDDSRFFKALNEDPKYNYEYMLPSLAAHGGNFFRTWICSWNLPIDWKSGFNSNRYTSSDEYYNPSALLKMDRMVQLSDSLGLYIMLTLGPGAYSRRDGGFAASAADFFVNPQSKARYKNRLRYIIARWGYSTAIAAWELFNEIDNVMYGDPGHPIDAAVIVKWHDEMSAYLKKTDPYHHLVTTSISHRDLPGLNALAHMDLNQKHIYRNTKSIPFTILQYENNFHKPYVIGEFAYEWDWSKNFGLFADEMDSDFKRGLWYGLFSPTPILPMSWWWEYFDDRGTDAYIARVRKVSDEMLAAGNGSFEALHPEVSSRDMETYGVQCGNKVFVYLYNPTDSSQLADITCAAHLHSLLQSKAYDCGSGQYRDLNAATLSDGILHIQSYRLAPKSDVVFVINSATP